MTTLQKSVVGVALAMTVFLGVQQVRQNSRAQATAERLRVQDAERAAARERALLDRDAAVQASDQALIEMERQKAMLAAQSGGGGGGATKIRLADRVQRVVSDAPPGGGGGSVETKVTDLPRENWSDAGFASPQDALRTRGWSVVNGQRDRFKDSVYITDGARQALEDKIVKMAEASTDPNKAEIIQQVVDHKFGVEEAILLPMMAEGKKLGLSGYRILGEPKTSGADETILDVETRFTSGATKHEEMKFRRIGAGWKLLIDEDFLQSKP